MNLPTDNPTTSLRTKPVRLDCWKVIEHFGGLSATSRLLREGGFPVAVDTIEKWRRRGSIPAPQLVNLAAIAKAKGIRFDIYDFILERKNDEEGNGIGPAGASEEVGAVI